MRVTKLRSVGQTFALCSLALLSMTGCLPAASNGWMPLTTARSVIPVQASLPEHATATAAPPATRRGPAPVEHIALEGADDAPGDRTRTVTVDLEPLIGRDQKVAVTYDVDALTRPTTLAEVRHLPKWVAGSRLLLGEVGIGRLRASKWSLLEGVGILQTVRNRLDPDVSNPLGVSGVAAWPGCGKTGTFQTCINPKEYLGIATAQALRPRRVAPDLDVLLQATDRAVSAWVVFDKGVLGDVTSGATSFVHRCGGQAYGQPTTHCDGRGQDQRGANPHTGPVVFKGPGEFLASKGHYLMSVIGHIDYAKGRPPTWPRAYADYLRGGDGVALAE